MYDKVSCRLTKIAEHGEPAAGTPTVNEELKKPKGNSFLAGFVIAFDHPKAN
jgi:hypothetical protein